MLGRGKIFSFFDKNLLFIQKKETTKDVKEMLKNLKFYFEQIHCNFHEYCKYYKYKFDTGCPTKHDSMQDDLNVVLIFDIICCVFLSI